MHSYVAWENIQNFVMRPLVFPQNDVWEMLAQKFHTLTGQYLNYPDLGSVSKWLKQISLMVHPIRSTNQFLVVICRQYRVFPLVPQRSLSREIGGGISKCLLFFWCHSYSMFLLAGKFSDMENKRLGTLQSLTNLLKLHLHILMM